MRIMMMALACAAFPEFDGVAGGAAPRSLKPAAGVVVGWPIKAKKGRLATRPGRAAR